MGWGTSPPLIAKVRLFEGGDWERHLACNEMGRYAHCAKDERGPEMVAALDVIVRERDGLGAERGGDAGATAVSGT